MTVVLKPQDKEPMSEALAEFKSAFVAGLPEDAVVDRLEPGLATVLFRDADCSLTFRDDAERQVVVVGWRIVLRAPGPSLGTWWASDQLSLTANGWTVLGQSVARALTEEVERHRNLLWRSLEIDTE